MSAMTGVIATLGYLSEKNRFVAEPSNANARERIHMRGAVDDQYTMIEIRALRHTTDRQTNIICR